MRFEDFVTALLGAGWKPVLDAQHENIERLWGEMFPLIAELEDEVFDLRLRLRRHEAAE